jgi:4-hydroxybenzoate polyprenyltransferase
VALSPGAGAALFVLTGVLANLGWLYYAMTVVTVGLLWWEHRLVRPEDLSRLDLAFFNVNSMVSFSLLVAVWCGIP